jgi:hypothetical protein
MLLKPILGVMNTSSGEGLIFIVCIALAGLVPGKNRYFYLVLFIIALCAAFYFLLYLYR